MSIAIIGSGAIGRALATRFARKAIAVSVTTRAESSVVDVVRELAPHVTATSVHEGMQADIVLLAVPFPAVRDLGNLASAWGDRIVVDATNAIDFLSFTPTNLGGRPSTQIVGELLRAPRVVKAFNTLPAALLAADPEVSGGRRVLFLSGDDASANGQITALIEKIGFAAVDVGKLAEGGRLQQFGGVLTTKNLVQYPVPGR
jgi:predicted dinucleotide-binding enzyme